MKKFLFSLALISFAVYAMDSLIMTTAEKVSLLEAFRCNTLQVKSERFNIGTLGVIKHFLQFPHIADATITYFRSTKDVHEYFKACFANQKQQQINDKDSLFLQKESLAEMEKSAELEKKSFVKKIFPDGLGGKPQKTEISQFTIEEQEQILQELLRPSFEGTDRDARMSQTIEPTRKWMLVLEFGSKEEITETLVTLHKVRPSYFVKPLNVTLQECAMQ